MEEGETDFLYAERICREKGGMELAQADLHGARLVFVGSDWFGVNRESEYQRQVREALAPVRDRVIFSGFVRYSDTPKYYALAGVAMLPSVWDGSSRLTVLEAQASGLPLISTLSGGIPQNVCPEGAILLERRDGLAERIARQMERLSGDRERCEEMPRAALEWSAGRNEQAYFDAFCALLEEAKPMESRAFIAGSRARAESDRKKRNQAGTGTRALSGTARLRPNRAYGGWRMRKIRYVLLALLLLPCAGFARDLGWIDCAGTSSSIPVGVRFGFSPFRSASRTYIRR